MKNSKRVKSKTKSFFMTSGSCLTRQLALLALCALQFGLIVISSYSHFFLSKKKNPRGFYLGYLLLAAALLSGSKLGKRKGRGLAAFFLFNKFQFGDLETHKFGYADTI